MSKCSSASGLRQYADESRTGRPSGVRDIALDQGVSAALGAKT